MEPTDLDQPIVDDPHDVTARDHVLLVLVAAVPFIAATIWYLLR